MKCLFILFLLFTSFEALADEWSAADKALLAGAIGTLSADWAQTRYIASHADYHEKNKMLGQHPSMGRVNWYFAGSIAGTVGIAYALPSNYRKIFLGGIVLLETSVVLHNNSIGIGMKF